MILQHLWIPYSSLCYYPAEKHINKLFFMRQRCQGEKLLVNTQDLGWENIVFCMFTYINITYIIKKLTSAEHVPQCYQLEFPFQIHEGTEAVWLHNAIMCKGWCFNGSYSQTTLLSRYKTKKVKVMHLYLLAYNRSDFECLPKLSIFKFHFLLKKS